jgi:dolichol kinase
MNLFFMLNSKLDSLFRRVSSEEKVLIKPWRKLWHVAGGLFLPLLAFFIPREALLITVGVVTGVFVAWEIARFVYPGVKRWTTSHLGIMLKREEQFQPTGSTFLLVASLIIFLLFEKDIAITSLLFVAIGDPVASIIGSKYGRHIVFEKSLEGSLACLIACLIIGILMAGLNSTLTLSVIVYGAICATVAEMLPIPADDNFTMPLMSASAMALAALYWG